MTDRLAEIEARLDAATPGPWINLLHVYYERMNAWHKQTKRWWHGTRRDSLPVVLIAQQIGRYGEPFDQDDIPENLDWYDLKKVIGWRWGLLPKKQTVLSEGFLSDEDADLIAHAPDDLRYLLGRVRELERENEALQDRVDDLNADVRYQE